jgi:monovalent cation:H+ antiporter-2, CPA2 family
MSQPDAIDNLSGHAIIAGFGVPGRAAAEVLRRRGIDYVIVELNHATIGRLILGGKHIVEGDAADPQILQRAGIDRAAMVVVAVPDERAALLITRQARQLNPTVRIITRCHYISAGIEARSCGADEVVIEEQAVANDLAQLLSRSSDK